MRELFVDAMLPDGSRLHVVIPDITRAHWSVNIRKFVLSASSMDEMPSAIPARELVITAEQLFELQIGLPDVVAMQWRAGPAHAMPAPE